MLYDAVSGDRVMLGSSPSVAGSFSGLKTRSAAPKPMLCMSRTLRTRLSQHRQLEAPKAPVPSIGAL